MDEDEKRTRARDATRRYRERLKQDPERYATYLSQRRKAQKASYDANREAYLNRQRAYVARNRALVYARNAEYAKKNREKIASRLHANYVRDLEANRAKDRERGRKRYAEDPERHAEYMKKWRAANPERARTYVRLSGHRRRTTAGGDFIRVEDWEELLARYEGRCGYCGDDEGPIEADHRTPLSRGGQNTITNIIPACRHCNRSKWTKTEEEFRAFLANPATGPMREKDSGSQRELAEVAGPYRTARSTALRSRSARSHSRSRARSRPGDRRRVPDRRRC